jgi:hypothetical protein
MVLISGVTYQEVCVETNRNRNEYLFMYPQQKMQYKIMV